MWRVMFSWVFGLAVAVAGRAAHGQADAPWDEARAVARALARSPAVRRAATALAEARALRAYATVPVVGNPTVGVRAMIGVPDVPAATWALVVGVPIDVGGVRGRWRAEAAWAAREAEDRLAVATNDARAQARTSLVDVAVADATMAVASARVATADEMLARTRTRADAGAATALDLALAEREAADATVALAAARRVREEASGRFRAALDLEPAAPVVVALPAAPTLPPGLTREAAIARAGARRREAFALGAAAARLRASAARLRAGAVPPLFVAGEVEWQGYSQASVGASLQWALPVAQTAQGDRALARAQAGAADVARDLAGRAAAREAATAWAVLQRALDELATFDARVLPAQDRTLAHTETLFQAGAVDLFRVLLARQERAAAQVRRLEALRAAWQARIALDRATGEP